MQESIQRLQTKKEVRRDEEPARSVQENCSGRLVQAPCLATRALKTLQFRDDRHETATCACFSMQHCAGSAVSSRVTRAQS